MIFQFNTAIT